jgi:hypothetical protein
MSSGNPGKQNVYNVGGTVTVCAYDERLKTVVAEVCDLRVRSVVPPSGQTQSRVIYVNGQITTDSIDDTELSAYVAEASKNDSRITFYVIDTTEIDITGKCDKIINSSIYDASAGVYRKVAFIPVYSSDIDNFKDDTMIKISVSLTDASVGSAPVIVNQSAYRVTSLYAADLGLDSSAVGLGYVIYGHVDMCSINELRQRNFFLKEQSSQAGINTYGLPELKVSMAPLHSSAVQYELRVTKDADETLYVY